MASIQTNGFASRGKSVLATHPGIRGATQSDELVAAFEACADCAQACIACADACLGEPDVAQLVTCIRFNQDCADLCEATGNILSRQISIDWELAGAALLACSIACQKCARECGRHAMHMEHCRMCEAACRACQQACEALLERESRNIAETEWEGPAV